MFSEESEERMAKEAALENEREERGLSLSDTRARVTKYDRLAKKTKIKVKFVTFITELLTSCTYLEC